MQLMCLAALKVLWRVVCCVVDSSLLIVNLRCCDTIYATGYVGGLYCYLLESKGSVFEEWCQKMFSVI